MKFTFDEEYYCRYPFYGRHAHVAVRLVLLEIMNGCTFILLGSLCRAFLLEIFISVFESVVEAWYAAIARWWHISLVGPSISAAVPNPVVSAT